MKKLLFVILALFVFSVRADNTITSKEYVDGQVSSLQTQIPAKNTNTVLTNTGTAGTVGEKAIYDTTAAYGTQSDALVTAGAFNTAVQNALESEFVCVEWQGSVHDNAHCLLYEVRGATQMQTLPAGYAQLEYLESTNTQYINTGIMASAENFIADIKYMPKEHSTAHQSDHNRQGILGAQTSSYTNPITLALWNQTIILAGLMINVVPAITLDEIHNLRVSTNDHIAKIVMDNNTIYDDTYGGSIVSNAPIFLFGYGFGANISVASGYHGRIYYCKLSQNNVLVRNFIPAKRDSDGELGMYDLVSNTFFTNSGTGEFIAGPVASYLPQNQQ